MSQMSLGFMQILIAQNVSAHAYFCAPLMYGGFGFTYSVLRQS
jgi:hypothetical protein